MKRIGFLIVAASLMVTFGALAQSSGEGLLNAVSYRPLPTGGPIAVRALDNSDTNILIQREFERQLQAKGYVISADALLILTFETRDEAGAWSAGSRRTLLELEGHNATGDNETAKARVNLFDSVRGGVFNEGQGGPSVVTPGRYRLDVTIDNRSDGKRLWQGWSTAAQGYADGLTTTRAMVPSMVVNLGQTVKSQRFILP